MNKLHPFLVTSLVARSSRKWNFQSTFCLSLILVFVVSGGLTSCSKNEPHEVMEDEDEEISEVASVDPNVQKKFGVRVTDAVAGVVRVERELWGEVVPAHDNEQHVAPQYSGVVQKILKHIGDVVRPGDVLAVVENSDTLTRFELKAGIPGTIAGKHIHPGETIQAGETAFAIVDTRTVWVQLEALPEDLPLLKAGQQVSFRAAGSERIRSGRLHYVSPIIDEQSRVGQVIIEAKNVDGNLRPGLFVVAKVIVDQVKVDLTVPNTAIQRGHSGEVVYIRIGNDSFRELPVTTGRRGISRSEIISGLTGDEKVVYAGAFLVKSEVRKGSIEMDDD